MFLSVCWLLDGGTAKNNILVWRFSVRRPPEEKTEYLVLPFQLQKKAQSPFTRNAHADTETETSQNQAPSKALTSGDLHPI